MLPERESQSTQAVGTYQGRRLPMSARNPEPNDGAVIADIRSGNPDAMANATMRVVFLKSHFYVPGVFWAAAILSLAVCLDARSQQTQAQTAQAVERSAAKKLTLAGVKNFGEVTPTLYRGAQPSHEGYEALAKMGVSIVVDGRLSGHDSERKDVEKAGMQYVAIPWHCLFPKDDVFARFLAVLRAHPGKKVFVHCRYGDDRTGMMIAAYRMSVEGWTADEARREMNQFGFSQVLCASLGPYENSFPERMKRNPALQWPTNAQPAVK
jgi:tyrosine-protein phosphatase SIW14